MIRKAVLIAAAALIALLAGCAVLAWKRPLSLLSWLERRNLGKAGMEKAILDAPTGKLAVWETGSGPPLLLLHGAGDHAGAWAPVMPLLAGRFRVLVPDLPGHGDSGPDRGILTIGMMLTAVDTILKERAGGQPAVIVGNSLGAWLAMLYAHEHPDKVARAVLVNGGPLKGDRDDLTLTPSTREEARRLMSAVRDPSSSPVPDFVLDDVIRAARDGPLGRLAESADDMKRYLLEGRLQEIPVPTDLLWGESDRLMPVSYAKKMAAQLPAARLTLIPRCGHVPNRECPERFAAALQEVLDQAPPQRRSGARP
jgi:pimeloyl-ACP methyl ester carboxylesterase